MRSDTTDTPDDLQRLARKGLWLTPVYALLLAVSTVHQQPDVRTEFAAYAEFVTTPWFLASHLVASIGGAALAVLGVASLLPFLSGSRGWRLGAAGVVITMVSSVLATAAFGSAAFTQPGIGRAYARGIEGVEAINEDTAYGTALMSTVGVSVLLMVVGAVLVGVAVARYAPALRRPGILYATSVPIFTISGILGLVDSVLQPASGVALAVAAALVALRLPRLAHRSTPDATVEPESLKRR